MPPALSTARDHEAADDLWRTYRGERCGSSLLAPITFGEVTRQRFQYILCLKHIGARVKVETPGPDFPAGRPAQRDASSNNRNVIGDCGSASSEMTVK